MKTVATALVCAYLAMAASGVSAEAIQQNDPTIQHNDATVRSDTVKKLIATRPCTNDAAMSGSAPAKRDARTE